METRKVYFYMIAWDLTNILKTANPEKSYEFEQNL